MFTIENDQLTVRVSSTGAEPYSICYRGQERLWQADPAVWGKHAPLLFPLIGRLRDGQYLLKGQAVDAPKHGFCRTREFAGAQISPTCIRFTTSEDDDTLAVYPFAFALEVEYAVEGDTLIKTHRITNRSDEPMPFELGGHEAYALQLEPGEKAADSFVQFDGIDHLDAYGMDDEGILELPKWPIPLTEGRLTQTPEQLGIDTIVVENVPSSTVTLGSIAHDHTMTLDFADFPYLGIWSMPQGDDTRYLCIEPWSALPDGHFMSRELGEKPGVRTVAPGETLELSYRMTFN